MYVFLQEFYSKCGTFILTHAVYAQSHIHAPTHTPAHKTHRLISLVEHHPAVIKSDEILKKKDGNERQVSELPSHKHSD